MEHTSSFAQNFTIERKYTDDVWLATSDADGSTVVVKRVLNNENPGKQRRLLNEIRAGEVCRGKEGLIQYLYSFRDEVLDCTFLVFQNIRGKDLFGFLEERKFKPMREELAKDIMRQLLRILEEIHTLGIAHLDLKLENIMLNPETNRVTIIDFGLCEFATPADRVSAWVGSPDYASPEILLHRPYNPFLSDIYSLGVVFYTLLFGQLPFNFDDKANNLLLYKRQPAIEWPTSSEVSQEARDLINCMISGCPEERICLNKIKAHAWFQRLPRHKLTKSLSFTCGLETGMSHHTKSGSSVELIQALM